MRFCQYLLFFCTFREMWEAVERNRRQENEETNKIEQHCKIVILPDRLHEVIDRRVKYRAR